MPTFRVIVSRTEYGSVQVTVDDADEAVEAAEVMMDEDPYAVEADGWQSSWDIDYGCPVEEVK